MQGQHEGKKVRDGYGQNGTGPVRAKRYGTGRVKTLRGPYGQNGTGPVRAKRYGAHTGYGAGAVRGTVWARYVARTFPRVQPVRATYRAPLGARTMDARTIGTATTMPVRACSLGLILLIVSSGALFITRMANRTIKYTHHLQNQKNWHLDKTRTIFSIVKPGTQTIHILSKSEAHAATITTTTKTTVIITNLPQFPSSEPSPQSS